MLNKEQTCTFETSTVFFDPHIFLLHCRGGLLKQISLSFKFPTADVSLSKMQSAHEARQVGKEGGRAAKSPPLPRPLTPPTPARESVGICGEN